MQKTAIVRKRIFARALAFLLIVIPWEAGAQTPQTTWNCGGEGEPPCGCLTDFFWENGNLFVDRGLIAKGFRVLPPIQFNAADWVNLNRTDMTAAFQLINTRMPALRSSLASLGEGDFVRRQCIGFEYGGECWAILPTTVPGWKVGDLCVPEPPFTLPGVDYPDPNCTIPVPGVKSFTFNYVPDFSRRGWNIHRDLAQFLAEASHVLAQFPPAIRGIPGNLPTIQFTVPSVSSISDVTSFASSIDSLKNFFTTYANFFNRFNDLILDFTNPPSTAYSTNVTRRMNVPATFQGTWAAWALRNQRELDKDEPFNWASTLGTHNAFNNAADGYMAPNQQWSLTDQLNLGARWISLDIHWFANNLRLSHATAQHQGASPNDRYYASGIKEIAAWVRAHPGEFVIISFEDRADGHDLFVTSPLEQYLGDLIYRAREGNRPWRNGQLDPVGQWPSLQELREAGKRVLVVGASNHNSDLIWSGVPTPNFSASRAFEFAPDTTNLFGFAADQLIGPFEDIRLGTQYETRSFLDPSDPSGYLTAREIRKRLPYSISEISLDMLHAQEYTSQCPGAGSEVCDSPDERIAAMVWSWAPGQPEDVLAGADNGQDSALFNGDLGRWESRRPDELHFFACARKRGLDSTELPDRLGQSWIITARRGPWWDGDAACEELNRTLCANGIDEDGDGLIDEDDEGDYMYSAPVNGTQNERLWRTLAKFRKDNQITNAHAWIACHDRITPGQWMLSRTFPQKDRPNRSSFLELDGIDDHVQIPVFGGVLAGREFTIEFWQKVDETRAQATLDSNGSVATNRLTIHSPWVDGKVYWDFGNINAGGRLSYQPPVPITGTWQHFAMVASASGNFMKIFRNGVEEAVKTGMTQLLPTEADLNIGASVQQNNVIAPFRGQIDELRIWSKARTATEIRANLFRRLRPEPNLYSYFRLDAESGELVRNDILFFQGLLKNGAHWAGSGPQLIERWREGVLESAPLVYHRLDEKAGAITATDASGHALHGRFANIIQNLPARSDQMASSVVGTGTNSAILLRDLGVFSQVTLSLWVHPKLTQNQQCLFSSGGGLNVFLLPDGGLAFDIAANTPTQAVVEQALTNQAWQHLGIMYNGIGATNQLLVYINGALKKQLTFQVARPVSFSAPVLGNYSGGENPFLGGLDEFAIFPRLMSVSEMISLYNRANFDARLTTKTMGTTLRILWSASLPDYPLYSADALGKPLQWEKVYLPPQTDGAQIWIDVEVGRGQRFYRLQNP